MKENFLKKLKLGKGYLPVITAVVVCFLLIGVFTVSNTDLWLKDGNDEPITAEGIVTVPETEIDMVATEGILDPAEPAVEPEEIAVSAEPVQKESLDENGDAAEGEINDEQPLEVSLFHKKLLAPAEGEWGREFGFGYDETFGDYRFHNGRDMTLQLGAIVYACENGTVIKAEESALWGGIVAMECKNLLIYYYGVVPGSIAVGDEIAAGEIIGTAAAPYNKEFMQGSHLHLVIMKDNEAENPADYFKK